MNLEEQLKERSGNCCELCTSTDKLSVYTTSPDGASRPDRCILVCEICLDQLEKRAEPDAAHWSCLRDSMWSEVPAVQVVAWRILNRLKQESWAAELID